MRMRKMAVGMFASATIMTTGLGCGVSPGTTLQELLDSSGLGSVTVDDVLAAIQNFTGQSTALPFGQTLTADQQAQVNSLQGQHLSGQIPDQEYNEQMMSMTGGQGPGQPFEAGQGRSFGPEGFRGGPRGMPGSPRRRIAAALDLTEEQRALAQEIFDAMREDVMALHQDAKTQIDAVLTDEQRAILDSLDQGGHDGFRRFGPRHGPDVLAEELGLTEDQQTQIQTILDATRTAVEARRQQSRDEFRAILTAEQQAQLDEFEANHPHPPHPPGPPQNSTSN